MDPKRLAAKQKRYKDWSVFFASELKDPTLLSTAHKLLNEYRLALASVWDKGVTPEITLAIDSLERDLEALNHETRVRIPGRTASAIR